MAARRLVILRTSASLAVAALAVGALAACGPSEAERAALAADSIVALAEAEGLVLRDTVGGRPLALMVRDCVVHDLADPPRADGRRPVVLRPERYPWPTVCERQSIAVEDDWVFVTLGRTAFGAGGCCAAGGSYRTRDGRRWEREAAGGGWTPVAADSVP